MAIFLVALGSVGTVSELASAQPTSAQPTSAQPTSAQPTSAEVKAAAEALFDEGRKLRAEGKYLEAAEKLEQSQKLDPGVGTLLRLADCYEQAGKLASAWANFRHAASMAAERQGDRRAELGAERAAQLEPRLPHLSIELGDNRQIDGLTIMRGDVIVDPATSSTPLPLDAGAYTVQARAPGYHPWSTTITIAPEDRDAQLIVPPLEPLTEPAPEPAPITAPPSPEPDLPPPPKEAADETIHPGNWVALGLGVGAVIATATGIGLVVHALNLDSEADEHCDAARCRDLEGQELSERARVQANGATAAFVVAGVLAGGALVTFFTVPTTIDGATEVGWAPYATPSGAGLVVGGRF